MDKKKNGRTEEIRILQHNMQRSINVPHVVRSQMELTGADIILMQEPYTMECNIPGFGTSVAIVCRGDTSAPPLAAVGIRGNQISALEVASLSTRHCACVQINNGDTEGKRFIVGADANAKSPLWFNTELDGRCETRDVLFAQHGLLVLNRPCVVTTFETTRGKSIIDVTLVTPEALPLVHDWKVHEDGTSSDHRILETRLNLKKRKALPPPLPPRYHTRKAKWEKFLKFIMEEKRNLSEMVIRCQEGGTRGPRTPQRGSWRNSATAQHEKGTPEWRRTRRYKTGASSSPMKETKSPGALSTRLPSGN
ncbi:PREDICTED: uncharacterized protein LOC108545708 [Eufriesea mexicana]|uniref:uncharacterized protein LOC108545708 n=1 Tax=Eufriesea mexicana TaxID=516756 RepID=UPI00083BD3EB|nr:PREDICTED: uncharacterized protein LOC108545708 [Eufriesea mexicana]